jgi:TrpR-related protein YerC/YecD
MTANNEEIWKDVKTRQFAEVLLSIASLSDMQGFLRDVMTEKELVEISSRLEAAKMLKAGKKYTDIVAETKLSSRTVARISDWLQNGTGGYLTALESIEAHHAHIPPARAE